MKDFSDTAWNSVEMTLVLDGENIHSISLPIGAVMTEKFNTQGNPGEEAIAACLKYRKDGQSGGSSNLPLSESRYGITS